MDRLADEGVLFTHAFCQLAWCAPSRNSFLSGRRPETSGALNFGTDFRHGRGKNWTTLSGYFKANNYYTTSLGKIFHPFLPPHYDFPQSWSDLPLNPDKPECADKGMVCGFNRSASAYYDADTTTTRLALERFEGWYQQPAAERPPLFLAVGYQGPRLPWSFPESVAERYPPAAELAVARWPHAPNSSAGERLEWFRPTEVDIYTGVNITHDRPMATSQQQTVRRAYYAAISHVDDQVGVLLQTLERTGLRNSTLVVLAADHGQSLGEKNMWRCGGGEGGGGG